MFISVDFPAPFSPRRACTSPRRRSKSTLSFARMAGNCFTIPRISRMGGVLTGRGFYDSRPVQRETRGGLASAPRRRARLSERGRRLDFAVDDELLELQRARDDRLRDRGVDPANVH